MKLTVYRALFAALFLVTVSPASAQQGVIRGVVTDAATNEPLIGVNVLVQGTQAGAASDAQGIFEIGGVGVGSYNLEIRYLGYQPVVRTDVIVRSGRITFLEVALAAAAVEVEAITVEADYFQTPAEQPVSIVALRGEEIRRAPGTAGDVSRIVYALPSVAKVNDTKNSLIVRGGGPTENGFLIDNIEIPNINHFPEQGSSGGPIGILNVDFIREVEFHAGGFPAEYGDRLSSFMVIDMRRGNPLERDVQLDLNLAGAGAITEGPLGNRGSYLLSARRSFLDLIVKATDEEETSIPEYGDLQGKLHFDLSPRHRLTVMDYYSRDRISLSAADAIESGENWYQDFDYYSNTGGVNWQFLWGRRGYSETSLSNTTAEYDFQVYESRAFAETGAEKNLMDLRPRESETRLRNVNHVDLDGSGRLTFGIELKHNRARYRNFYASFRDQLGAETDAFRVDEDINETKSFAFFSYRYQASPRLSLSPGLRVSHYTYNGNAHVSPRVAVSYRVGASLSVSGAAGLFRQFLPLPLLAQNPGNEDLNDPLALHVILGVQKQLAPDTRLTLEVYNKEYRNFPMDPDQPELFIIDQVVQMDIFLNDRPLVDEGRARTRGAEVLLQKKLARTLYGLVGGSYFRSRYEGLDGVWRDRAFDNRVTVQIEGGYKPNNKREFSLRWLYGGGVPYTPFDVSASRAASFGVLDASRVNDDRLPAYHALNVRFDRRFHYGRSNLVAYLSIWNAYGRTNVSGWEWDELSNEPEALEQWGMLPIFGLEFEF